MRTLLRVLGVFGILYVCIFVHEAGHLALFKWQGVGVDTFKVGLGPTLLRFQDAETDYELGLIPIGGYNQPASQLVLETYSAKDLQKIKETRPAKYEMLNDKSRYVESATRLGNFVTDVAGVLINFMCAWLGVVALLWRNSPGTDSLFSALGRSVGVTGQLVKTDTIDILSAGRSKAGRTRLGDRLKSLVPGLRSDPDERFWLLLFISISTALGIFNLLPVPPLDGGKAMLELIQMATGTLDETWVLAINLVGVVLIIGYIIFRNVSPGGSADERKTEIDDKSGGDSGANSTDATPDPKADPADGKK